MEIFELKANYRKNTGKGPARVLRGEGIIPAVLYGPKTDSMLLAVQSFDLSTIYKESGSEHVIVNLTVENGVTQKKTAMIKEVQTAPVSGQYLHIDFLEISLEEEVVVKVPVEVTGKSVGVERGGFLQLVRHALEVSCLPTSIPKKIQIDVSTLDIGDALHIEQVDVGEGVELVYDTNFTVATVVAPAVEKEELEEEEVPEEVEAESPGGAE